MAVKVDEALRAHVRSTLPEAPAGEARTGDAEVERRADDERSEADGTGAATTPKAASRRSDGQPGMALK